MYAWVSFYRRWIKKLFLSSNVKDLYTLTFNLPREAQLMPWKCMPKNKSSNLYNLCFLTTFMSVNGHERL